MLVGQRHSQMTMAAMGHVHAGKQDVSSVNLVHNIYPWECASDTLVT